MKKNHLNLKYIFSVAAFMLIVFLPSTLSIFAAEGSKKKDTIVRVPLLTAELNDEKNLDKVEIKRIQFSPHQKAGTHIHPIPVVGYIAEGEIYFQIEGEKAKILHAGDAFYEPANVKILHFDNTSSIKGTTFIAYYLMNNKDKELIQMMEND